MAELTSLTKKRGSLKAQLTKFKNYIDEILSNGPEAEIETFEIETRLERLSGVWENFNDIQARIEEIAEDEEHVNYRSEFEDTYFKYVGKARRVMSSHDSQSSHNPSLVTAHETPNSNNVKLPKLEIEKFNGSYDQWRFFYDTFHTTIHSNTTLSNIQKLTYLRNLLKDEAANVIKSLDTSAENYEIALSLLKERYDNKRVIVNKHLKSLLEHPQITKSSASLLRQFLDKIKTNVSALKALDQNIETCESLFIYLMTAKLDKSSHLEWEKTVRTTEIPPVSQFLEFLQTRCHILEATEINCSYANGNKGKFETKNTHKRENTQQSYVGSQPNYSCPNCNQAHSIYKCESFLNLSIRERNDKVRQLQLCLNCLKKGHSSNSCRGGVCKLCKRKHSSLLHYNSQSNQTNNNSQSSQVENTSSSSSTSQPTTSNVIQPTGVTTMQACIQSEVLLSTARVDIIDRQGKEVNIRVLLDPGSQSNFITEKLATQLQLPRQAIDIPVSGIGQLQTHLKHSLFAKIKSKYTNFNSKLQFLILPRITGLLPTQQVQRNTLNIPQNIHLADPEFHRPTEIDALIGAELFYNLLCIGQIRLNQHGATLQKTKLGWIVSGKLSESTRHTNISTHHVTTNLNEQLDKFWSIEELPEQKLMSPEERACEEHFVKNTRREESGRFVVSLPFNDNKQKIGNSYRVALKRFYSLERQLGKDAILKEQYTNFLREYEQLHHMSESPDSTNTQEGYYLPHHSVIKNDSVTTKIRVVFDASAKSDSGFSLNDTLMVGPTIQDDIYAQIMRFRFHNFVLMADIEKMYRQVKVCETDKIYQKILWREEVDQPIKTYILNTVTYGTASAPFLATRVLQKLAEDDGAQYPRAANALLNDVYVDNFLTGARTVAEAQLLRDELMALTKRAGFNLRQWSSNEPLLTNIFDNKTSQDSHILLDSSNTIKTLGIHWNSRQDEITYSVKTNDNPNKLTKRTMLSQIAQLFDPLGLLGPVIIAAKIMMQELWKLKIDWDESVPQNIHTGWNAYRDQLSEINHFKVPRKIITNNYKNIQLHGFCDASERAYGACLYIRSTDNDNTFNIQLLCAKSRVAPLKSTSLPRLELCAALLLTKLYESTIKALKINFDQIIFWSDSTITLQWIKTPSHTLKTFIANRVSEIQRIADIHQWRHVSSQDNPADFISRGQQPSEFVNNQLWLTGPSWLRDTDESWPSIEIQLSEIPEKRLSHSFITIKPEMKHILERYSSMNKLIRVMAYCFRFMSIIARKNSVKGPLTTNELKHAHDFIIKQVQTEYHKEIKLLTQHKPIDMNSKLLPLTPFIDTQGLLRVGGRLQNADLPYSHKHPILLPKNHHITKLIIQSEHIKNWHAGTQATLSAVRQRYWILDGKNTVRRIIHNCVKCFRAKPRETQYLMGNLPQNRLQITRPFTIVGVDYCGPFFVKEKRHRNRNKVKTYVSVFICFSTKAIHMEVVSDLSTEAFLAAFRRFCARRGKPQAVYSDNATNFVGAKNEINELQKLINFETHNVQLQHELANEGITWHFSPPRSPHFGGLWEAAVKSFKHHLKRTIGDTLFTFEELNTYVTEIEAILNSRPLIPLSSDPNDFQALTPSHFLIGDLLKSVPEQDFRDTVPNRLSSWQLIQRVKQHFWTRWQKEYINELNTRSKWQRNPTETLKIGTLVIVKEDNLQPQFWRLGRIVEVYPGADNVIRVVTVKTVKGLYKRSAKLICPLPIENNDNI